MFDDYLAPLLLPEHIDATEAITVGRCCRNFRSPPPLLHAAVPRRRRPPPRRRRHRRSLRALLRPRAAALVASSGHIARRRPAIPRGVRTRPPVPLPPVAGDRPRPAAATACCGRARGVCACAGTLVLDLLATSLLKKKKTFRQTTCRNVHEQCTFGKYTAETRFRQTLCRKSVFRQLVCRRHAIFQICPKRMLFSK